MKTMRIIKFHFLFMLLLAVSFPAHTSAETLRAAVPANFPPHYKVNKAGTPEGFAIDVIEAMAAQAGLEISYTVYPGWPEVMEALKTGQADIIPNLGITEPRKQWADFTRPVETFPVVMITRKGSPLTKLEDLKDRKAAAVKANVGAKILAKHPEIETILFTNSQDAFAALLAGEVDAWVYPESVAWLTARRAGLQDRIKVAGSPLKEILRGVAVSKDKPELLQKLNQARDGFINSREYQNVYAKWHGAPEQNIFLTKEEQTWLAEHPVIRVHNERNWPPFNYNDNGEPAGFSIDYMNLLASRIGIKVDYVPGEWGELLDLAFNKKLDVMLNIVNTPERQKHLLYTGSYVKNPNVIIADNNSSISDTKSLSGKKVAYPEGFFYDKLLKTKFPEIIRVPMKKHPGIP